MEVFLNSTYKKVLTCGVFDVLHAGHVRFFNWVHTNLKPVEFIVALNTDESLDKLRRPHIHNYYDRETVLLGLRYITTVVPMNDVEPTNIIMSMHPHIFVKGGDYLGKEEEMPEYKAMHSIGGQLIIYPFKTHSSRGIIDAIRKMDACRGCHDVE